MKRSPMQVNKYKKIMECLKKSILLKWKINYANSKKMSAKMSMI
jgi:hypothetical protein